MNWKAQPLVSYRVIVDLIGATTTKTGLIVRCEIDNRIYPKEILVSDKDMASLNITRDAFHEEWSGTTPSIQRSQKSVQLSPDEPLAEVARDPVPSALAPFGSVR